MIKATIKLCTVIAVFFLAVALIAEAALPGDVLYRFKIGVNEPVKGWLINDQGQAAFEIARLHERLGEIDQLVVSGKLDAKSASVAREQVANQLQTATAAVTASAGGTMTPAERAAFNAALEDIKRSLLSHQESLNQLILAGSVSGDTTIAEAPTVDLEDVTDSFTDMIDQITGDTITTDTTADSAADTEAFVDDTASSTASTTSDGTDTLDTSIIDTDVTATSTLPE